MAHPEYLYYVALVAATLLVLFNRLAAVVVVGWAVAQLAGKLLSLHDHEAAFAQMLFGIDVLSFIVAIRWTNRHENATAIGLYAPMAAIHIQEAMWHSTHHTAGMHPYYAYWAIYCLAMLQIVLLPFGTDWHRARVTMQAYRRNQIIDRALRLLPC